MKKSESIKSLAVALSKFQAEVRNPVNSANNPFFKSKYAPLNEVLNGVRPLLSSNGLSVMQSPSGDGQNIILTTLLLHESGEWIEPEPLVLKADKATAQGAGSAITYARRYALSAILGISSEDDDDGNHATYPSGEKDKQAPEPSPSQTDEGLITRDQGKRMYAISGGDSDLCQRIIQKYGYKKSTEVLKKDYEKICTDIERTKEVTGN